MKHLKQTSDKVLFVLLIACYVIAISTFGPSMASPMTFIIEPFLLLAGVLNFVTDDPALKRKFLNVQLFVTTCFAVYYAGVLILALRFSSWSGFVSNVSQFVILALIIIFLALLERSQEKAH